MGALDQPVEVVELSLSGFREELFNTSLLLGAPDVGAGASDQPAEVVELSPLEINGGLPIAESAPKTLTTDMEVHAEASTFREMEPPAFAM